RPVYPWYQVSAGVTNLINAATKSSYTTAPVQDSDTGTGYFVLVSNSIPSVRTSSTAILTAGHMVSPASGVLENDEFYGTTDANTTLTQDLYPGSAWLTTHTPDKIEYLSIFNDHAD